MARYPYSRHLAIALAVVFACFIAAGLGMNSAVALAADPDLCEGGCTYHLPLVVRNFDADRLAFEDFSDPTSGWYEGENAANGYAYRNGAYEVTVKQAARSGQSGNYFGDVITGGFSAAVDVNLVAGAQIAYGLILDEAPGHFYLFQIFDEGQYVFLNYNGSTRDVLVDWTESPYINPAGNRLSFERRANTLAIYIDGHLLHSVPTTQPADQRTLVYFAVQAYDSSSVPAVVRYDNLELRRLSQ